MKLLLTTIESECRQSDLELKYLYSVVADAPMDVRLMSFAEGTDYCEIFEETAGRHYNIVYFHCNCLNEGQLLRAADMLKKASPSTAILFGGMHVSFETRQFMEANPFVDYVIRGEGESVLFSFIKALVDRDYDFGGIAGLAYRKGDQTVVNPFDAAIDMEDLPFPYERFDPGTGIVYYETIRGTSDRTVYSQHLPDARIRALSLGRVCTELRYFLAREVERVVFFDRFFNYNSERAYRIFEYIINNDNGVTSFEFFINADELDDETLRLVSEARKGLFIFHIDAASTNADVLTSIGRSENIYRLMYNASRLLRNGNIRAEIHICAGLPLETAEMFARSFNKAYGMAEGMPVHIDSMYMSKGTVLRDEAHRFGYVYASEPPYEVIASGHMKAGELLKIRAISAVVDSFEADGGFKAAVPRILKDTGLKPFDLFSSLTSYINRSNLKHSMLNKENRARILMAFSAGLYDEFGISPKLETLREMIAADIGEMLDSDTMEKFVREGWDIEPDNSPDPAGLASFAEHFSSETVEAGAAADHAGFLDDEIGAAADYTSCQSGENNAAAEFASHQSDETGTASVFTPYRTEASSEFSDSQTGTASRLSADETDRTLSSSFGITEAALYPADSETGAAAEFINVQTGRASSYSEAETNTAPEFSYDETGTASEFRTDRTFRFSTDENETANEPAEPATAFFIESEKPEPFSIPAGKDSKEDAEKYGRSFITSSERISDDASKTASEKLNEPAPKAYDSRKDQSKYKAYQEWPAYSASAGSTYAGSDLGGSEVRPADSYKYEDSSAPAPSAFAFTSEEEQDDPFAIPRTSRSKNLVMDWDE